MTAEARSGSESPVVGRALEVARLRAAFDDVRRVGPLVLLVSGEAGIGKTAVVREACGGYAGDVIWVTADEGERALDFGVVDRIVRRIRVGERRAAVPRDAFDAGVGLLEALDDRVGGDPLILVIDDAHLADTASLETLSFVARRLDPDDVALVLISRDDGVDDLPGGLRRLADGQGGPLVVGPLDVVGVGELVAARHPGVMPTTAIERLHAHTSGNPLHTLTLLEELDGATLRSIRELPTPRSFQSVVVGKLASCSFEARRCAAALAILDAPSLAVDVASVAGVDDATEPIAELCARRLVTVIDDAAGVLVEMAHALIADSVVDALSTIERADLHRRASAVTAPERALAHRLAAAEGPDPNLAREAEAAGDRALARGLRTHAAELYLAAARVAPERGAHERLVLAAAEQQFAAGRSLGPWARAIPTFAESAHKRFVEALQVMATGRFDRAAPMLIDAHAAAEADGERRLAGLVAEQLSIIAVGSLSADEVLQWSRAALDAGVGTMPATVMAHGLALGGNVLAAREAMAGYVDTARDIDAEVDARLGHALVALWSNDLTLATAELEVVLGHHRERGALRTLNAFAYLAELRIRQGRVVEGVDLAEHAAALAEDLAMEWLTVLPRSVATFGLAITGDLDRARAHADAAASLALAIGQVPADIWSTQAAFRIAVAEQDHHTVVTLGDAMVASEWSRIVEGVHHWGAAYSEALLAIGRVDAAAAQIDRVERDGAANEDVSVLTDAARARIAWADAVDDGERADRVIATALAADPVAARPFERARLELAVGARQRRLGKRTQAAALLDAASRRFAAMGAQIWLERGQRELVSCGLRPRRRAASASADLTPAEREVASAVAGGLTNREIASQLAISAKTVEHHLSRVYAKLGIRGRAQVAAALADPLG